MEFNFEFNLVSKPGQQAESGASTPLQVREKCRSGYFFGDHLGSLDTHLATQWVRLGSNGQVGHREEKVPFEKSGSDWQTPKTIGCWVCYQGVVISRCIHCSKALHMQ